MTTTKEMAKNEIIMFRSYERVKEAEPLHRTEDLLFTLYNEC